MVAQQADLPQMSKVVYQLKWGVYIQNIVYSKYFFLNNIFYLNFVYGTIHNSGWAWGNGIPQLKE